SSSGGSTWSRAAASTPQSSHGGAASVAWARPELPRRDPPSASVFNHVPHRRIRRANIPEGLESGQSIAGARRARAPSRWKIGKLGGGARGPASELLGGRVADRHDLDV